MSLKEKTNKIVRDRVLLSMAAGVIPIPFADMAAITAIQIEMMSQLSTAYGVKFSPLDAENLIKAVSVGGVAKVGSTLVKLMPGVGSIVGGVSQSAIAGASTYALAQVVMNEYAANGNLSNIDVEAAKSMYRDAFDRGREYVSNLEKEREREKAKESDNVFDKLERLAQLRERGLITDEEFKLQKQKLLERL